MTEQTKRTIYGIWGDHQWLANRDGLVVTADTPEPLVAWLINNGTLGYRHVCAIGPDGKPADVLEVTVHFATPTLKCGHCGEEGHNHYTCPQFLAMMFAEKANTETNWQGRAEKAEARVKELEAERQGLVDCIRRQTAIAVDRVLEIGRLELEIERLEADEKRLDWIDRHHVSIVKSGLQSWSIDEHPIFTGPTLREEIDAAMQAESESPNTWVCPHCGRSDAHYLNGLGVDSCGHCIPVSADLGSEAGRE